MRRGKLQWIAGSMTGEELLESVRRNKEQHITMAYFAAITWRMEVVGRDTRMARYPRLCCFLIFEAQAALLEAGLRR